MKPARLLFSQVFVKFILLLRDIMPQEVDPTNVVQQLGFNLIWSHDKPYNGQAWEETHMYKMLQIPDVKYVFAKIERAAWGWTYEQSLKHARWVAELSLEPCLAGRQVFKVWRDFC